MSKFDLNDLQADLDPATPDASPESSSAVSPEPPARAGLTNISQSGNSRTQSPPGDAGQRPSGDTAALSELYTPQDDTPRSDEDLGAQLLEGGIITAEQLANAQRVIKQTPGKNIAQILNEMGVDEAATQKVMAELARLPFERVQSDGSDAYDEKALYRLGAEF